jgi:8-oxo-dGTP pyrophosphatase MutT (NUDIX family)
LGTHEDSAKLEILSNAVYDAMGVAVPKMRVYHTLPKDLAAELGLKSPYGIFKVCEYIGNDQENNAQEQLIKDTAARNFVAHVLIGNIDVTKPDNFIVSNEGVAYLIDAGANFIFRALGELREEQPEIASEIDSLRNKKINPSGASWFSSIDDKEIAEQVRVIHSHTREIEEALWHTSNELELTEELRQRFMELLSDRLDILTTRFTGLAQVHAKTDKKALVDRTAAGVLSYTLINNIPHVLLSKRAGHEWWDNFGGKSDAEDKCLIDTAKREVKEESNDLLKYSEFSLRASPFHDIITSKRNHQFLYRMYIAEHEYVEPALFKDHEHTEHQWVAVSDILRAIKSSEMKVFEGKHVKVVQTASGEIPLFQPLCHMLEQPPVLEHLEMLCHSRKLDRRCTLGYADEQCVEGISWYRPLITVDKKRHDLAVTMLKKNKVLKQVKCNKKPGEARQQEPLINDKAGERLSPSELHMAAVLGRAYTDNNVLANVELMINQHFNTTMAADKKQQLIEKCASLVKTEKDNPDRFHFYHGCNSEAAFAYDVYSALYQ